MKVLSLFDGISCAQIALQRAGFEVDEYYASEIDKHAIEVTQYNFPKTIQLGTIKDWPSWWVPWEEIDLIVAGFSCQSWSVAGKQEGDNDPRGALVHDLINVWKRVELYNPNVYFLFENVKMKGEFLEYISNLFGVEPILINSALLSAQNRNRYYWTNIPNVEQPEDKGIILKDIILDGSEPICFSSSGRGNGVIERRLSDNSKAHTLTKTGYSNRSFSGVIQLNDSNESQGRQPYMGNRVYSTEGKSVALTREKAHTVKIPGIEGDIRKLTPVECERLQTVPDNYTKVVSKTQRYRALGNGFTVDVIAHILKNIPVNEFPQVEDIF